MSNYFSLREMKPGEKAVVTAIHTEGDMRRRFLDLGLTEGTTIKCVSRSIMGDPAAYLIRGAVVALRGEDSAKIEVKLAESEEKTIVFAGNPNVGKSTVFNALTGLRQHTGNWHGKTVGCAAGRYVSKEHTYNVVDIPGTYSLAARSREEKEARDFLLSGSADCVVIVCDATCLERNMNLALQIMEICPCTVLCVNLMDEARRKNIEIDINLLEELTGVPAAAITARKKSDIKKLIGLIDDVVSGRKKGTGRAGALLREYRQQCSDDEAAAVFTASLSEEICRRAVKNNHENTGSRDRKIDNILTGKISGWAVMAAMLTVILWITVSGANYPSQILSRWLFSVEQPLSELIVGMGMPMFIHDMLVEGLFRVTCWVISVMLPPMAIFFPLFTLLEDMGFLPRIAFNLDRVFRCCGACGKQALTACMGLGCNAAGVTGCRIIDSPRERMLAILTNSFIPCNGKFAALIALTSMFLVGEPGGGLRTAALMTAIITGSVILMFAVTKVLSATLLRGMTSAFTLELPPYRLPQVGRVIVRSVFDRTVFVLGRAVCAAAPAGIIVWLMANICIGGGSILMHMVTFLEPLGSIMGLDGAIITAFVLGIPANEIIIPMLIMIYSAGTSLEAMSGLTQVQLLFAENGWTWLTALCMLIFFIAHWPCATTLMTIKKETGSFMWTAAAWAIPTFCGFVLCTLTSYFLG